MDAVCFLRHTLQQVANHEHAMQGTELCAHILRDINAAVQDVRARCPFNRDFHESKNH